MATSTADPLAPYYFKHEEQTICGRAVTPITDEYVEGYPSVVDRFFTRYYYIKEGADAAPYQVLFHSNRVCLICLAPEHPARQAGIKSISFDIGNSDRSKNTVTGKGKKGGMPLQVDSTLALLTTEAGKTYKIPSCVRSKLIEVNVEVMKNPKRLESAGEGEGYLAIVLPKPEHCEELKASLLTQEQYKEKWAEWLLRNGGKKENEKDDKGENIDKTTAAANTEENKEVKIAKTAAAANTEKNI